MAKFTFHKPFSQHNFFKLNLILRSCWKMIQAVNGASSAQQAASDWQEYEAGDGRR